MAAKGQPISFLERFEGKKSTISKQGILHMLNMQTKHYPISHSNSLNAKDSHVKVISSKKNLQSFARQIIRNDSNVRENIKAPTQAPSSRLSNRTQMLRHGEQGREFVLPRVRGRFNNSQQSLYNRHRLTETERNAQKPEQPKNMGYKLNKNMDVNALEHLQFLTRLEQKLIGYRDKK